MPVSPSRSRREAHPTLASVGDLPRKVRSVAQRWRMHPADALSLIRTVEQAQGQAKAAAAAESSRQDRANAQLAGLRKAKSGGAHGATTPAATGAAAATPTSKSAAGAAAKPLAPMTFAATARDYYCCTAACHAVAATAASTSPKPPSDPRPASQRTTHRKLPTIASKAATATISG
eukprot:gene257-8698_t